MTQKTKKQHYVPQFYLKAWGSEKNQINVFDKKTETKRKNNILDVASERFFYDIDLSEFLSPDCLDKLKSSGVSVDKEDKIQIIEKVFAEDIEKPFSDLLKKTLENAKKATPWHINNCFSVSLQDKVELSEYLAVQFIRLKKVRNVIQNTASCLNQLVAEMGGRNSDIAEYATSKEKIKNTHLRMLVDEKSMMEIAGHFYNLTWMLGLNTTEEKFYTSDNPICTYGHIKNGLYSMSGIASKGVEVFFPLSPNVILVMVDGSYHTQCLPYERRYIKITQKDSIDYYNSILAMQAERFVFSSENSMVLIDEMIKKDPEIFKHPHTQMSYGGKIYYPKDEN